MRLFKLVTINVFLILVLLVALHASGQQNNEKPIAFPGAEGFGKYTTGGRGGVVWVVKNLNDDGPGSFREAAVSKGKRIILFTVAGTIHLQSKLIIQADATIAGQTAPGEGICVADHPVQIGGDNVIIRYLRFRLGDKFQRTGMVNGSGSDDALGAIRRKNLIIDHCSISWSTDEALSVYAGDSTTLQWNIISEPLNYSYHFEVGDKDYERHGYGGIWGGLHLTAHHNLFAHCNSRTPRFNGIRHTLAELVDFRNNVIYNWGGNNIYAGEGGEYNIVNNYFKYGPNTKNSIRYQIINPGRNSTIDYGRWYVSGNYVDGSNLVTKDNWSGVSFDSKLTMEDKVKIVVNSPHYVMPLPTESAIVALNSVLAGAGASFRRDTLDQRIIKNVIERSGSLIDVQGGFVHGTNFEQTLHAWPTLKEGTTFLDTDKDGIPDEWEKSHQLDPSNHSDGSKASLHPFYTNIELYINSILK